MASCQNPGFKKDTTAVYSTVNKNPVGKKKSGHKQQVEDAHKGGQKEFVIQDYEMPDIGGPLMEVTPLPFQDSVSPSPPVDTIFTNLDSYPLEEQIDMIYASSRKFTPLSVSRSTPAVAGGGMESVQNSNSAFDRAFRKWEDKMQKGGLIEKTNTIRSWSDFELVVGETNPPLPPNLDLSQKRNTLELIRSPSDVTERLGREIALNLDKWYLDSVCSRWEVEQLLSDSDVGAFCITNPDNNGFLNLYLRVDPLIHNTSLELHKIGILYRRYKIRESPEYFYSLSSLLTYFCSQSTTLSSDIYLLSPQTFLQPMMSPGAKVKLETYPLPLEEKDKIYSKARDFAIGHETWLIGASNTVKVHERLNRDHTTNFLIWHCQDTASPYLSIFFEDNVIFECKLKGGSMGFEIQDCPIIFPSISVLLSYLSLFNSSYIPCNIRYSPRALGLPPPNYHSQNLLQKLKLEAFLTEKKGHWFHEVKDESAITPLLRFRHIGSFLVTVSETTNYTLSMRYSLQTILHFPVSKNSSDYTLKLGTFIDSYCSLPALLANSLQLVSVKQGKENVVVTQDPAYPFVFSFDAKRHKIMSQITYKKEDMKKHLRETEPLWFRNGNPPDDTRTLFFVPLALRGHFILFSNESIPFMTLYLLTEKKPHLVVEECLIESNAEGTILAGKGPTCSDLIELISYCCLHKHEALPLTLVPPLTTK